MKKLVHVVVFLAISVFVSSGSAVEPSSDLSSSSIRPLVLPIPENQTWFVCQGYNGPLTHEGVPALDLSRDRGSPGPRGCMAGSKYSSAGSVVNSPATGIVYRWPGCCGHDFICINFDTGGSAAIGHLSNRVASGTRVETGSRIGTVSWPRPANGDYAHIHVQVHSTPNCTEGNDPVAFDVSEGFKWQCTPNLPYSGAVNQYSGLAVKRCGSSGNQDGEQQGHGGDASDRGWAGPGSARKLERLAEILVASIRSAAQAASFDGSGLFP